MTGTKGPDRAVVAGDRTTQHTDFADRPESLRQAQRWEVHKGEYLRLGLCHPCAGQGAYGRQCGFGSVRPPCGDCLPLLGRLPVSAPNGWRRFAKDPASALTLTADLQPVSSDLSLPGRSLSGAEEAA